MKRSNHNPPPCVLIYADKTVDLRPSPGEIYDALRIAQRTPDSTVIIERDKDNYFRSCSNADMDFAIDVRDGGDRRHFRTANKLLPLKSVQSLMTSYVISEEDWKTHTSWKPLTRASVSSPVRRKSSRSPIIERQGNWIFISKHWILVLYGILCYVVALALFLIPTSSGVPFLTILTIRDLLVFGTTSLLISNFVRD